MMNDGDPEARTRLIFEESVLARVPVHLDISAAARIGGTLILACDETAGLELLSIDGPDWSGHRHLGLDDLIALPDGPGAEIDIEGLSVDGDWLWVTGSQALKRRLPRPGMSPAAAMHRLGELSFDGNRQLLARLPLVERQDGMTPVRRDGDRYAQAVDFSRDGRLRRYVLKDPMLAPFVPLPGKENGLDVEGVAAQGLRVWLGLRGPVLRGYAVVLEMAMEARGPKTLKPRRLDGRLRFRKHLLPLGGEGVRDLALDGDDLLILSGTTLDGHGRSAIYRWVGAVHCHASGVRPANELRLARALPYAGRTDNAEGLCGLGRGRWLVLHDSPAAQRLGDRPPHLLGDVWTLTA